ncbi:hypothetical protein [Cysteiniphilum sp. JM-1]|uniref:hypothetical protein n=1 Tax=Cysteiniphilum sp. JM-1 TaxID=2610891 RepID=UPI0012453403|nr:hypothetical protein [Cysteiniphilum sp. JM-1]
MLGFNRHDPRRHPVYRANMRVRLPNTVQLTRDSTRMIDKHFAQGFPLVGLINMRNGDIHLFPGYQQYVWKMTNSLDGNTHMNKYYSLVGLRAPYDPPSDERLIKRFNRCDTYMEAVQKRLEFLPRITEVHDARTGNSKAYSSHEVFKKYIERPNDDVFAGFSVGLDQGGHVSYQSVSRSMNQPLFGDREIPRYFMQRIENCITDYISGVRGTVARVQGTTRFLETDV